MNRYSMLALCIYLVLCGKMMADDWTQFRGNHRDGKSLETKISDWSKKAPELISVLNGAGQGFSSLCVVGDNVYTMGNSETTQFVVCFSLADNKVIWKQDVVDVLPNHAVAGSRCTPTYDDELLYVVSSDGQLFALDPKQNGEIVWKKSFQEDFGGRLMSVWGYSESPLVDGQKVIVTPGGPDAMVVALNKKTGNTIWKCNLDEIRPSRNNSGDSLPFGAGYSSILKIQMKGDEEKELSQYVAFVGSGLIGIDSETGKVIWKASSAANKTANICMPVFGSKQLVYSSSPKGGTSILPLIARQDSISPLNNADRLATKLSCNHGGMILHNDHLFFATGNSSGLPTCFDIQTQKVKWGASFRGPGRGPASVVYVDEKIIFRYQNGVVAMAATNTEKYEPLGHFRQKIKSSQKSWAYPAISGKKLLLRENDAIMVYRLD